MPKNQVTDPITDQEITFARLVLSGTVTDRQAAESAGLNPDTAAYTKAKPRVQAYLLEHRAALNAQLAQQEAEELKRKAVSRQRILDRLWEIANLSPEATRNSATAQMKALSLIIAIEGLIPDRRAAAEKKADPPPITATFYKAAWRREQERVDAGFPPSPVQDEDEVPPPGEAETSASVPSPAPGETRPLSRAENPNWVPQAFMTTPAPNQSIPYFSKKHPWPGR